jgi:hypothetical protein
MGGTAVIVVHVAVKPLERENYFTEYLHTIIYSGILILGGIAHLVCMFTDPGSLTRNTYTLSEDPEEKPPLPFCKRCA